MGQIRLLVSFEECYIGLGDVKISIFLFFFFYPLNEQATLLSWNDFAKLDVEGVCNVMLVTR